MPLDDGGGLHLLTQPNGSKLWRLKYRFTGKGKLLAFGTYLIIGIADAHRMRDEAKTTLSKSRWLLNDLASSLSNRPVREITPAEILIILQKFEKSGRRETARRLRGTIGSVFRFAIATLRAVTDPTVPLHGALFPLKVVGRAAITDEKQFGAHPSAIEEYNGWPTIRTGLKFLILICVRPGEAAIIDGLASPFGEQLKAAAGSGRGSGEFS